DSSWTRRRIDRRLSTAPCRLPPRADGSSCWRRAKTSRWRAPRSAVSNTRARRRLGVRRDRELQLLTNLAVNLTWLARAVDHHHQLLPAEQIDDRLGLFVVVPEPPAHRDIVVVRALHHAAAAHVAHPFFGGPMKHQVVVESARRAQSSRLDPLEHDL